MPRSIFLGMLGAMLGVTALHFTPALADSGGNVEYAVKATYLYKFAPFIQWPDSAFASPNAPFNICVVGNDAVGDLVAQAVAGQRYGARPMSVRKLAAADGDCQILYMPGSDPQAVGPAFEGVRGKPVLTVTDLAANPAVRGMVAFVIDGGHVRFDIDGTAAAQSGLSISSKLLSLSRSGQPRGTP
jgi:uncharacterized Zn-binding protein involved in type VI secretion